MSEEVLIALNDLTNGALNYYQAIETVMVRKQVIENYIKQLQQENQELKKQLEEINKMIEKCGFVNIEQVMLNYCGLLSQQKEFIDWLEDKIKFSTKPTTRVLLKSILQNYKEIIGGKE